MTDATTLFKSEIRKARLKAMKKEMEFIDAKIRLNKLQIQYFELQMRSKEVAIDKQDLEA